jgi:hypothetical protein
MTTERRGRLAAAVAMSTAAVLTAGVVTAVVRTGGSGTHSQSPRTSAISTDGWTRVVDHKVGFIDRLPDQPVDSPRVPVKVGPYAFSVRIAAIPRHIVIERETIPDLSASELADSFRAALYSFAGSAGLDIKSDITTTFHGLSAREGTFAAGDGRSFQAVVFVDGAGDLYMIASPVSYFDAITRSFQVYIPASRALY